MTLEIPKNLKEQKQEPLVPIIIPNPEEVTKSELKDAKKKSNERDKELITIFNAEGGDPKTKEAAFTEITTLYRKKIFDFVSGIVRNRSDAEEVTSDVFIRAHRGLGKFLGLSSLYTWLFVIARRLSINKLVSENKVRKGDKKVPFDAPISADNDLTLADVISDEGLLPGDEIDAEELSTEALAAMGKISAAHREILTMRNIKHMTYEQIALALGINEGTVKSRIARARQGLNKILSPKFEILNKVDSKVSTGEESFHNPEVNREAERLIRKKELRDRHIKELRDRLIAESDLRNQEKN